MAYEKKANFGDATTIRLGGVDATTGKPNPKSVEGYYLGSKSTPDKGYGPGTLHFFQTQDGIVGVWGKTVLNNQLTPDLVGMMVLAEFTGMGKKVKGKNPAFLYEVHFDRSNTTDVAAVSLDSGQEPDDGEDEGEDEGVDGEDAPADEIAPARATPPRVAAKPPTAEQQSRVQNLLSRTRNKTA